MCNNLIAVHLRCRCSSMVDSCPLSAAILSFLIFLIPLLIPTVVLTVQSKIHRHTHTKYSNTKILVVVSDVFLWSGAELVLKVIYEVVTQCFNSCFQRCPLEDLQRELDLDFLQRLISHMNNAVGDSPQDSGQGWQDMMDSFCCGDHMFLFASYWHRHRPKVNDSLCSDWLVFQELRCYGFCNIVASFQTKLLKCIGLNLIWSWFAWVWIHFKKKQPKTKQKSQVLIWDVFLWQWQDYWFPKTKKVVSK